MSSERKLSVLSDPDSMLDEVKAFRARFPIFRDKIHLANNAMGAVGDVHEAACRQYLDDRIKYGASWDSALEQHARLRELFAKLIGAKPSEIAVCYGATQAISVIASCYDWKDKDSRGVVFDDYSFPSVAQLWHAQAQRGARLQRVAADQAGLIQPSYFDDALSEGVDIVSAAHVCYKNGHRLDIDGLAQRTRAAGALLIVDDYQHCGSRAMNVHAVGVDILVAGTVKYLLGGPGVTLMYVREGLHDRLHPTITGWFAQTEQNAMGIDAHLEAPDAAKFQSGTPAVSAIYESVAGLDLVLSVGVKKIEIWIKHLTALLMRRLLEEGFSPATPLDPARRGAQIAIRAKDASAAVEALAARGITSTHRDNNVRTAWHFYNTPDDVEALIEALCAIRPHMA